MAVACPILCYAQSFSPSTDSTNHKVLSIPSGVLKKEVARYKTIAKDIENDLKKAIESPLAIQHAGLSYMGKYNDYSSDALVQSNYNQFYANLSATAFSIPFAVSYQNNNYSFTPLDHQSNRIAVHFDRQSYIDAIKKRLEGKFNPKDFLDEVKDGVETLKSTALKNLELEFNKIKEKYKGMLNDKLKEFGNPTDLFSKDPAAIKKAILTNEWASEIQKESQTLAQLQNRINTGQPVNPEELKRLTQNLEKYKGVKELLSTLEAHYAKWQQSGLISKIRESGLMNKETLRKITSDPEIIRNIAKQKLDLNGLQRLFLSVTKLNIGQVPAGLSKQLTGNSLLNGISTGFLVNKKTSIDILGGTQRTINSLLDMPFANGIYNTDNRMLGVRLNKCESENNNSSFSFLTFQASNNLQLPFVGASVPRKSIVFGFSRQIQIAKAHQLDFELSKSNGKVLNDSGTDSTGRPAKSSSLLNTDNLLKSIAATVNYKGTFDKIDLQTETFLRSAGLDYDNPGTSFTASGAKEAGLNLRKSFLKKRLQVSGRSNWRLYKFSEVSEIRYLYANHSFDLKWKLKHGQSVAIRYQPSKSIRFDEGFKTIMGTTGRLAATASVSAKLKKTQYRNYFTLALLKNNYGGQSGYSYSNKSVNITSLQSITHGKNLFFSNTVYNDVNKVSSYFFFNTSFSTDLGVTYTIGKNLSSSSSVNYNSVKGWYQQLALRQSINGELGKKISMSVYIDIGKNLKTIQPLPYSLFKTEWSIQYLFNR